MTNQQGTLPNSYVSGILLTLVAFTVFIVPVFPRDYLQYLYPVCFTAIFLVAAISLQKHRKYTTAVAITLIVIIWISIFAKIPALTVIARVIQFIIFLFSGWKTGYADSQHNNGYRKSHLRFNNRLPVNGTGIQHNGHPGIFHIAGIL